MYMYFDASGMMHIIVMNVAEIISKTLSCVQTQTQSIPVPPSSTSMRVHHLPFGFSLTCRITAPQVDMKLLSTSLSVACVTLGIGSLPMSAAGDSNSYNNISVANLVPTNISSFAIATTLTTKSSTVPTGTKTYVVGLRTTNATRSNSCAGTLISSKHVLTGGACGGAGIRYASIGSHYNNGTEDGERIKIVAIMNHPNNSENYEYSYDFVVLELQRPSSFTPIKLGAADGSDIKDGEVVTKLGWYNTGGEGQDGHELQRADVHLISNEECSKETFVDESRVCSAPVGNQSSCTGDYGGPLIVERPEGDILVGSVSWGDDCRKPGYPSYYSRLSTGLDWIESITKGECFH